MSYREFVLNDVEARLGLTISIERLFPNVVETAPRPDFLDTITEGVTVAQGSTVRKRVRNS